MPHDLPYAANCSVLFTEWPLSERPAAARDAGFDAIELWWPWPDQPVPADAAVDELVSRVLDAGVSLIGLNFFAGDLAGPDCGILSLPGRTREFRDNVQVTVGIGEQLGVTAFNALYGVRLDDVSPQEQDELAVENLRFAAEAATAVGGTVLLEPVSGPKPYPLRTAIDVVSVLERVDVRNLGFLCDLYHLANNGDDLDTVVADFADRIAHVQIADWPGRHEPGTGTLDLSRYLDAIAASGYSGHVALEYLPSTTTLDSLTWFHREEAKRA